MEASHHHHDDEGGDEDVQALSDSVSFHVIPIRIESFLAEPSTGVISHTPLASLQASITLGASLRTICPNVLPNHLQGAVIHLRHLPQASQHEVRLCLRHIAFEPLRTDQQPADLLVPLCRRHRKLRR